MEQFELNFDAGLTDIFPTFEDCVKASVYGCGRQFKAIAMDLGDSMSSAKLSRMLNASDPLHFPIEMLPKLIAATGDLRPIYWLVETFCDDGDAKQRRALAQLPGMIEQMQKLLNAAGAAK